MKDFLKIFLILCFIVASFLFGRSYGEKSFRESAEYQDIVKKKEDLGFAKNDFENVKAKVQNIVDGAENKKSEELLAQILEIFLADLGIQIQNQKNFIKGCEAVTPTPALTKLDTRKAELTSVENQKPATVYSAKKLKSSEWILSNSTNSDDVRRSLKNVEIKDIDAFMKGAIPANPKTVTDFFGKYRGRIMDISNKEYGTLAVDINSTEHQDNLMLNGSFKIFKNGQEQVSKGFRTNQLGFTISGSSVFIVDNGNTYFQLYKIKETQQLAGFYYERLPQGTTKTIGSFLLNRTDQF